MGCLGAGEATRGEQLRANQGQEWREIRTTSKRSWFSKKVKRGASNAKDNGTAGSKGRVIMEAAHLYILYICVLYVIC